MDNLVTDWFAAVQRAGLVLPDGWFGKPYDCGWGLVKMDAKEGNLVLFLHEAGYLFFDHPGLVSVESSELVIGDFKHCTFSWLGADGVQRQDYESGQIRFVPIPGWSN